MKVTFTIGTDLTLDTGEDLSTASEAVRSEKIIRVAKVFRDTLDWGDGRVKSVVYEYEYSEVCKGALEVEE